MFEFGVFVGLFLELFIVVVFEFDFGYVVGC